MQFQTMNSIAENIKHYLEVIPPEVTLIAVSKRQGNAAVQEAYEAGQLDFGENYVQELVAKHPVLPSDIRWHFIGHLQSNKVKYIAPFIHMIHSVDSIRLLGEIDKQARRCGRQIPVLLEIFIATEESKSGMSSSDLDAFFSEYNAESFPGTRICGVMGMASFIDNQNMVRNEFKFLKQIFNHLKYNYFTNDNNFTKISMGMSSDYGIAIDEGSNMIRIGTAIFGQRH